MIVLVLLINFLTYFVKYRIFYSLGSFIDKVFVKLLKLLRRNYK